MASVIDLLINKYVSLLEKNCAHFAAYKTGLKPKPTWHLPAARARHALLRVVPGGRVEAPTASAPLQSFTELHSCPNRQQFSSIPSTLSQQCLPPAFRQSVGHAAMKGLKQLFVISNYVRISPNGVGEPDGTERGQHQEGCATWSKTGVRPLRQELPRAVKVATLKLSC